MRAGRQIPSPLLPCSTLSYLPLSSPLLLYSFLLFPTFLPFSSPFLSSPLFSSSLLSSPFHSSQLPSSLPPSLWSELLGQDTFQPFSSCLFSPQCTSPHNAAATAWGSPNTKSFVPRYTSGAHTQTLSLSLAHTHSPSHSYIHTHNCVHMHTYTHRTASKGPYTLMHTSLNTHIMEMGR